MSSSQEPVAQRLASLLVQYKEEEVEPQRALQHNKNSRRLTTRLFRHVQTRATCTHSSASPNKSVLMD